MGGELGLTSWLSLSATGYASTLAGEGNGSLGTLVGVRLAPFEAGREADHLGRHQNIRLRIKTNMAVPVMAVETNIPKNAISSPATAWRRAGFQLSPAASFARR